jgi:hypothetical protein
LLLLLAAPSARVSAAPLYQTIPTRTPTPEVTPTSPPSGGGNPTATQEPPPASTTGPTATQAADETTTATATLPVTAPQSSGQFATAQPCGMEPTLQAISGRTKVRSGPGEDYEDIGSIAYLEVRPIVGRATNAPWWQIALADGTPAWIADAFVTVHGYTGAVPLVPAPALPSGAIPTQGPAWNPTPNPVCTPESADALSRTPTPTSQPTATRLLQTSTRPASTATDVPETATTAPIVNAGGAGPEVTATAVPPPTSALVSAGNPATQAPTAAPLEADSQAATALPVDWLPILGVGLVIAGVIVYFVRRR